MVLFVGVYSNISIRRHMCIDHINLLLYVGYITSGRSCIPVSFSFSTDNYQMFIIMIFTRMARMEAAVFCGLLLGALSCSYLYNMTSAAAVFFCAAVSSFIALLYLIFFIQESVQNISADVGKWVNERVKRLHIVPVFNFLFNFLTLVQIQGIV